MPYNADLTWTDLSRDAGLYARTLHTAMRESLNAYDEWQSFRAGRTNAALATALNRTESEVAEMDSCYAAFKEIYDFANNTPVPLAGDRLFAMRKFS